MKQRYSPALRAFDMNKKYSMSMLGDFKNGLNFQKHTVNQPCKMIGIPDFGDWVTPNYETLGLIDKSLVNDENLLKNGDILFVRSNGNRNLVGRTMIIQNCHEDVSFSGFCIRFRPNVNIVLPMYLLYVLRSPMFRKRFSQTQQSNINNINQDTLGGYTIDLPDMDVQRKIAHQIEILDRKIHLNNAINTELDNVVRKLYDFWFVQFDFPNTEGKPYRASGGEMVWSDELKRELPKGWPVKAIADCVIQITTGLNPRKNFVLGQGSNRYITIKNIENGRLDFSKCDFVDDEAITKIHNRSDISVGDILFTSIEPVGRLYRIWEQPQNWDINESVFSIRANTNVVTTDYLYATMDSEYFRATTLPLRTGSVQKGIRIGDLQPIKIPIPSRPLLLLFTEKTNSIYKQMWQLEKQNTELTTLRDSLLPLLMNGQVTVSGAEIAALKTEDISTADVGETKTRKAAVFKRLVLSAFILDNICDEPTAGRVKFEKLLFLSEHCAQLPFNSEFHRAAAGPYDPQALYGIESQLQKNKWFMHKKVKGESRAYTRMEKSDGYKTYVGTSFDANQKGVIDKLINLFKSARTIQCEIVATLYGAWNDFLIDGIKPTDDQIVDEVLTNWHERKERIERDRWLTALGWMRKHDIVPTGYGISTKQDAK